MSSIRILLIQIRKDKNACVSEYETFLEHLGIRSSQLDSKNLYYEYQFGPNILDEYDAFLVGGFSDDPLHYLGVEREIYPFIDTLQGVLDHSIRQKIPGLLSCGGFMFASVLLGGTLKLDPNRREMDLVDIAINEELREDPLLSDLPDKFAIVSGHLKSTTRLPSNSILLASSERCPIHAFKVKDAPFYAFQGHPEITAASIKERVAPYKDKYFTSEDEYLNMIHSTKDTEAANSILSKFVTLVKARKQKN